ncbi:aminoglycoside phosphotransferase [Bacillus sp. AFS002410]|uniref:phosphotransferase enzyme family protein n=1 Tax=Bacillus sp. AFS002410 TaxID=2033481 RepID=UPI000BEFF638|nr:phosphotransferase [Bacillus sp. AFS002410]PEJ59967.1 aminoglycoside phosphotransferase [Bacillus sp. AFS002410]
MNLKVSEIVSNWDLAVIYIHVISNKVSIFTNVDGKKYVLKQKEAGLKEIIKEHELLNYLNSKNISVQIPLINKNGEDFCEYKEEFFAIYEYFEGDIITPKECLEGGHFPKLFGEAIAKLHKAMETFKDEHDFTKRNLYNNVFGWAVNVINSNKKINELNLIFEEIEADVKNISEVLPKQLIHRDPHTSNFIMKHNELVGIIDFEIAEESIRIFDVCYCATSILNEVFSDHTLRQDWIAFVGELFNRYSSINQLSDVEANSIWHTMLCIQTIFMAYFIDYPNLFDSNKEMFLWIYENRNHIEKKIVI